MDLTGDLDMFTVVAEEGSFSAAGRRLNLAPSSVARVVDRIENRLGVSLLLRTTRSLTLTPEGRTYLASARRILADLRETEQLIAHRSSPKGRLRVSISLLFGRMFVVPLLPEFAQRHPDILLEVISTDTIADIAAGQADVAVRLGPLAEGALTARKLGTTHKVIVASPTYLRRRGMPGSPEDLHNHDCISLNFKRAAPTWPFRRNGRDYSLTIKATVETNNGDTQGQLAREGMGIARVCTETAEASITAGQLVPLLEEFNPGDGEDVHAVFIGGAHTPARVRCFVDYLCSESFGKPRPEALPLDPAKGRALGSPQVKRDVARDLRSPNQTSR